VADFFEAWPHMEPIAGQGALDFVGAVGAAGVMKPVDRAGEREAWIARHRIGAAWAAFSTEHPITLAPVSCERPWLVGDDIHRVGDVASSMRMVVPLNALGLPACAVPVGCDEGLPQGVQLIGARFREDLLLDAAQAIEDRAPVLTPIQPRVAVTA